MTRTLDPNILADWWTIARRTKRVYYVRDFQSRSNMGAAYTLYVVWRGKLWKAWPSSPLTGGHAFDESLAKTLGFQRRKAWRAFYRGGCGYDRVHDIVYDLASHFGPKSDAGRVEALKACNAIHIEGLGDHE